ncbi:14199_t:CDS:2, partial [Gigaspora margarita]
ELKQQTQIINNAQNTPSTVDISHSPAKDKKVDEFLDSTYKAKVSNEIKQDIKEKKLRAQDLAKQVHTTSEQRKEQVIEISSTSGPQNHVTEKCQEISSTLEFIDNQDNSIDISLDDLPETKTNITTKESNIQHFLPQTSDSSGSITKVSNQVSDPSNLKANVSIPPNKKALMKVKVRILPINKNASLNSHLLISILPDDPEEKRNFVIKIADFRPIIFEAKPDSELIIKSVLEHFTYLKFRNSFRGIDNYSFASPQLWSSLCPICDRKHGNYGLHSE